MKSALGKTVATSGALVAACVACCAPLLVAPATALLAAGGLSLALLGQIGIGILIVIAGGAGLFLWRRRASAKSASCGCAGDTGNASAPVIAGKAGSAGRRCSPPI